MVTADAAPRPASRVVGLWSMSMLMTTMTAMKIITIFSTPHSVYIYCCLAERVSPSSSLNELMKAMPVRTIITVM